MEILDKNIVGTANTTRFIILSKNAIYKENANKISLMFELKHTSGALYSILANFIFNGMEGLYGATDTAIIRLGVYGGKILYVENYPAKIEGTSVRLK